MENKQEILIISFTIAKERAIKELESLFLQRQDYESLAKLKKIKEREAT